MLDTDIILQSLCAKDRHSPEIDNPSQNVIGHFYINNESLIINFKCSLQTVDVNNIYHFIETALIEKKNALKANCTNLI